MLDVSKCVVSEVLSEKKNVTNKPWNIHRISGCVDEVSGSPISEQKSEAAQVILPEFR